MEEDNLTGSHMGLHHAKPISGRIDEHMVFFDTESWVYGSGKGVLRLGVAQVWKTSKKWDTREWRYLETLRFYEINEFIALLARYPKCVCIAHNTGHDYLVLGLHSFLVCLKRNTTLYSLEDKGPFVYVPYIPDVGLVTFIDLCNWFPVKLKVIGKGLGYEKIDLPPEEMDESSDSELFSYCETDTEVLRRAYFSICEIAHHYGTNPALSAASMSKNIYLTTFLPKWRHRLIWSSRSKPALHEAEIDAYFGGRTDALYKGPLPEGFTIYKYDVNSHYPGVMLESLPIKSSTIESFPIGTLPDVPDDSYYRLYQVVINITKDNPYWILGGPGVRREHEGAQRILYPIGRYKVFIWQHEYTIFRAMGFIERVDKIYPYESAPILSEFATHFFERRAEYKKEGNRAYDLVCKLIMNSLYGKFGQKNKSKWVPVKNCVLANELAGKSSIIGERIFTYGLDTYAVAPDGVHKYIPGDGKPAYSSIMSIAGAITSIGRARLMEAQKWVIDNGGNVYYCDTDSIMSDIELPPEMVSSTEMGKFKLEATLPSQDLDIQCRKHYIFGDEIVIKGINRVTHDGKYYTTTASSLRVQYRNVTEETPAVPGHSIEEIQKIVSGKNNCRIEPEERGWTEPVEINEDVGKSRTEQAKILYEAAKKYLVNPKKEVNNSES